MSAERRQAYLERLRGSDRPTDDWARWAVSAQGAEPQGDALARARQALKGAADAVRGLEALGGLHHACGEMALAEAVLAEALRRGGPRAQTLSNHALVLAQLGRLDDAEAAARQSLALAPDLAAGWTNLGLVLRLRGDEPAAAQADRRALELDPQAGAVQVNVGLGELARGQPLRAIATFRAALARQRELPETWTNLGLALQETADAPAACRAFEQALRLAPHDRRAASNLLMGLQYHPGLGADALREAARQHGERWGAGGAAFMQPSEAAGRPLRVGYVGADFREHPVGWMLLPVLQAHDRRRVEPHLFDTHAGVSPTDSVAPRLAAAAAAVHRVSALDDDGLAARVQELGIDVLVDLAGHTLGGRPGLFARRVAPLQLAWLGYFASTGLSGIDGVVLGAGMADRGAAAWYVEPVLAIERLHFAYAPPDVAPEPAPCPSLQRGAVTFGCFNNAAKLCDDVVACWSAVLQAVPDSRLVLKWRSWAEPAFAAHTRQRFAAHGVDPERIEPRGASPHAEMLAQYGDIDIALDPFPFSGALTTLEALWMGVPVVTLPWLRPVSRQTEALLAAVDLHDLVARTPRQVVEIAARLAADVPRRAALRTALRGRMRAGPLGDGASLARCLEALFERQLAERGAAAEAKAA